MPVLDGVKAMSKIRSLESGDKVPIIALTASGFDDKREPLLKAEFDDYVLNPFTESVLLKSIADHSTVGYEISEESEQSVGEKEEMTVFEAMSTWQDLGEEARVLLAEYIEIQEIDEIINFAKSDVIASNHPKLAHFLLKAAQSFDFFKLNQLFKAIKPSQGD